MNKTKHPFEQFNYCPKCGSNHFVINNEKSKRCNDCGFVYYFNACASTVAIIFNKNKELLVATRAHQPAQGTFDLPGGFVDMHETAEEAVKREVLEETHLIVNQVQYLFSEVNIYPYSDFEVHTLDMIFLCQVNDFSNIKAEDDVSQLQFIPQSELDESLFGLSSIKKVISKIKKLHL